MKSIDFEEKVVSIDFYRLIDTITIGNAAISAMPVGRDLGALLDQHLLL